MIILECPTEGHGPVSQRLLLTSIHGPFLASLPGKREAGSSLARKDP